MANPIQNRRSLYQIGKQSAFGTAVAATHQTAWQVQVATGGEILRPTPANGIVMEFPGAEKHVSRMAQVSIPEQPAYFEEMHWPMLMSVQAGVTGSEVTPAQGDYLYTFTRTSSSVLAVPGMTLERRKSDGSTHVDDEWADFCLQNWTYRWVPGGAATFQGTGFAGARAASTLTSLASYPDLTIQVPQAHRTQVWMDATWANLGTTLIGGEVLEGSLEFRSGLLPGKASTGNSDLDPDRADFDGTQTGFALNLTIHAKAGTGDLWRGTLTLAEAAARQAIRVQTTGSQIGTGTSRAIQFDMMALVLEDTIVATDLQDGTERVTATWVGTPNPVSTFQWFAANITNDINNLPS